MVGQALNWESEYLVPEPGFVEVLGKPPSTLGLSFPINRKKELGQVVTKGFLAPTSLKREAHHSSSRLYLVDESQWQSHKLHRSLAWWLAVPVHTTSVPDTRWPGPLQGCRFLAPAPRSWPGKTEQRPLELQRPSKDQ